MIRDAILAVLQWRHWTHQQLATASGVSRPKISRWLGGAGSISVANAERVMSALGIGLRTGRIPAKRD